MSRSCFRGAGAQAGSPGQDGLCGVQVLPAVSALMSSGQRLSKDNVCEALGGLWGSRAWVLRAVKKLPKGGGEGWEQRWGQGAVVLSPGSGGSRGLEPACTGSSRGRRMRGIVDSSQLPLIPGLTFPECFLPCAAAILP